MIIRFAILAGLLVSGFYNVNANAGDISQALALTEIQATDAGLSNRQVTQEGAKPAIADYTRNAAYYTIPDVLMVDSAGRDQILRETIDYGGPVMVQFIFASCSTVCPILSYSFSVAQPELDTISNGVYRLISISIDPEQDRPEKLHAYAERFKAGKNWYFLTGKQTDVEKILKAFDASYVGSNKMFHKSLTFMRGRAGEKWIRIEGLLSKKDIIAEYKNMPGLANPSN